MPLFGVGLGAIVSAQSILCWRSHMSAKPVQVSLDEDLLRRIDADQETMARGRSAFIRSAVDAYFAAKRSQRPDEAIAKAYQGRKDELLAEAAPLLDKQAWPDE